MYEKGQVAHLKLRISNLSAVLMNVEKGQLKVPLRNVNFKFICGSNEYTNDPFHT